MLSTSLIRIRNAVAFTRVFGASRNVLALVGIAALCGLLLPQQHREGLSKGLAFVGDPFGAPATVAEGPERPSAVRVKVVRSFRSWAGSWTRRPPRSMLASQVSTHSPPIPITRPNRTDRRRSHQPASRNAFTAV